MDATMRLPADSAQTRGEGISGLIGPESYDLAGWENRVFEALAGAIEIHVETTHRLPSIEEYSRMALAAIEKQ
jgi:hypothetical protein